MLQNYAETLCYGEIRSSFDIDDKKLQIASIWFFLD